MNAPHPNQTVELLGEPSWGFDDKGPSYFIRVEDNGKQTGQTEYVDPAPCYHHNLELVTELFELCRQRLPLPIPMKVAIMRRESVGRTNGWYTNTTIWYEDENKVYQTLPVGIIALMGKRIPIHPAMTRYLVAHEYGHGVQYAIERKLGMKSDEMEPFYREQFRPDVLSTYGPGNWHSNVGELIANDFRILVMRQELEFWPHEGFQRPEDNPRLVRFWAQVVDMFQNGPVV